MTPAERALLLAVAVVVHDHTRPAMADYLRPLIAAVEAEAAPEAPSAEDRAIKNIKDIEMHFARNVGEIMDGVYDAAKGAMLTAVYDPEPLPDLDQTAGEKSCETCSSYLAMYDKCLHPRDGECLPTHQYWQPKPSEASECPTCGYIGDPACGTIGCPDCDGTGGK